MNAPNFVFYDTETTGTNVEFDQILQFSAILTDRNFKEIDRINVRCRRLPWIIPSPQAMVVTRNFPSQIDDLNLMQFPEMMSIVREKLQSWSPAIFLGYNSFRFDEPLLQRAFWLTFQPPYLTVTKGNSRGDVLPLVRAVSRLAPHVLTIPNIASGHPVYRLDRIAPSNGFAHLNAHDALGDVQALIHLCKKIASRSRAIWSTFCKCADRRHVSELLNAPAPIFFADPMKSGKPGWWGISLDSNLARRKTHLIARLDADWRVFFTKQNAFTEIDTMPYQIRRVKENMPPLMFSQAEAMKFFGITPSKEELDAAEFLRQGQRTELIATTPFEAIESNIDERPLEQRIFDGFTTHDDELIMEEFVLLPWQKRAHLIHRFDDPRLQQIAQRLVFLMAPETLPDSYKIRVEEGIRERLLDKHTDKGLWRTINLARAELDELRHSSHNEEAVNEISEWLTGIEHSLKQ